ncbi:MAG: tetratricopeptide repeat protein [Bryobacteraceae bacterium]|nr:tetratricopeptide repeat protein [Bryobacteraceae bacterium]
MSSRAASLCIAVVYFTTAIQGWAQSANPSLLKDYFQEGEKALAGQHYAEAARAYEKLRQLDPQTAEVHARLGLIYFQQGNFPQAVTALRHALKLKPGLPKTDVLLAMSLSETGKYRESLAGLESGFRQTGDPALRRMSGLQLQRAHTALQQDGKAVEVALQMSQLYPKDPEVLYHTGQLFGNFAYVTMRKLSEEAPDSVWTIQAIGQAQESQGAYDMAILRYRKVISLAPRRPGIHYRLARALQLRSQQKDTYAADAAEAVTEFERELALDPTNANAAYELGVIHYRRGDHGKAHDAFAMAIQYDVNFQEAEVGMGRTLLALNKPGDAIPYLRKAVSLNPLDEVPHYQLSRAYQQLGNNVERQKALAEFRRLREERSREEAILLQRAVTRQEVDSDASSTP